MPGPGFPRPDAQTRHVLTIADRVIVVGRSDPVGLARVVRSLHDLSAARTGSSLPPVVVMNHLRSGAAWSARDVTDAVGRLAGIEPAVFIPADFATVDTAVLRGTVPVRIAPDSAFARAFGELVDVLEPLGAQGVR
jgi:MinD-like ATPase involved in chromosome partitioning or flagellar assembly